MGQADDTTTTQSEIRSSAPRETKIVSTQLYNDDRGEGYDSPDDTLEELLPIADWDTPWDPDKSAEFQSLTQASHSMPEIGRYAAFGVECELGCPDDPSCDDEYCQKTHQASHDVVARSLASRGYSVHFPAEFKVWAKDKWLYLDETAPQDAPKDWSSPARAGKSWSLKLETEPGLPILEALLGLAEPEIGTKAMVQVEVKVMVTGRIKVEVRFRVRDLNRPPPPPTLTFPLRWCHLSCAPAWLT